ncbi:MAG: GntR family transcriptional regulator, partial [Bacteroidetes bacterium]|nr:GntR family transcriptional regulator [Bacteroidota bacterium]
KQAGGFLPFSDNSSPAEIHAAFGMSKKLWKKSVGALYKKQLIQIDDEGIRLIAED